MFEKLREFERRKRTQEARELLNNRLRRLNILIADGYLSKGEERRLYQKIIQEHNILLNDINWRYVK